ncbi:hypothetical protein D9M71_116670 [compost metagenome]
MGLGETVAAKALDLLENPLDEIPLITLGEHPRGQPLAVVFQAAMTLPGGHVTAQFVRLAGRVVGGDYRQLHHLFLEQRHAQGALEYRDQLSLGIGDLLFPLTPAQVGMDHVPLDRPRTDDGDLDHQVVERPGFQARQHGHLRPRLDLEYADGVGAADHVVGGLVLLGQGGEGPLDAAIALDQREAAAQRAEHAQRQHVHL